jgi:hypothetical protein
VHFALSNVVFYLDFDVFFSFSCSFARCFFFTYLFVYNVLTIMGYLFCFILISWGCLTSPTLFFFLMNQFNWLIAKKP